MLQYNHFFNTYGYVRNSLQRDDIFTETFARKERIPKRRVRIYTLSSGERVEVTGDFDPILEECIDKFLHGDERAELPKYEDIEKPSQDEDARIKSYETYTTMLAGSFFKQLRYKKLVMYIQSHFSLLYGSYTIFFNILAGFIDPNYAFKAKITRTRGGEILQQLSDNPGDIAVDTASHELIYYDVRLYNEYTLNEGCYL